MDARVIMFLIGIVGAAIMWRRHGFKWTAIGWLIVWSALPVATWFGLFAYDPSLANCHNRNLSGCFKWLP